MSVNTVTKIESRRTVNHVIISVADKSGLEMLVAGLVDVNPGIRIYTTGGTYSRIKEILGGGTDNLISVSDFTGQPEMQGGLVKTLDFKIYLGLLSESFNTSHAADIQRVDGVMFDMVVGNLYPFKETIARADSTMENARGNIDIGGPCMLRAAAKNYIRVAAVCDPADYGNIVKEMQENQGRLSLETRFECARKAFRHTADYDTAIAGYLEDGDFSTVSALYDII